MDESAFIKVIAWGVCLLIGYYGLGVLSLRWLKVNEFVNLGISSKTVIGMCISIIASSLLMVFGLATAPFITVLSILSLSIGVYYIIQILNRDELQPRSGKKSKSKNTPKSTRWGYLVAPLIFVFLALITSVFWPMQFDPNDDWVAYLTFPEIILQTGTLLEPFSQRRVQALGGQSILLSQIFLVGKPENAHLLDRGFGVLLLFGLMVEATKLANPNLGVFRSLVLIAAVTASVPRINTASSQMGIVFLLTLMIIVSSVQSIQVWNLRTCLATALVLAGASSLRPTFAILGGGILVLFFILRLLNKENLNRLQCLQSLVLTGIFTFLWLVPLMIVSWDSSRTPMFPFAYGNANKDFVFFQSGKGPLEDARITLAFMLSSNVIVMTVGFLAAFLLEKETRRLAIAIAVMSTIVSFLLVFKITGTAASWIMDIYRFTYPLYAFAFFWILAKVIELQKVRKYRSSAVIVTAMIAIFWSTQLIPAFTETRSQINSLGLQFSGFSFPVAQLEPAYKNLQNQIPEGEKVFATLDAPYLLDYKRNTIDNVDMIGCASVPPGMPIGKGSAALKDYLTGLGYKYVLCVDFNNAVFLYSRQAMSNHQRPEYKEWAKNICVDFMDNMDEIAKNTTIARAGNARLIKLQ